MGPPLPAFAWLAAGPPAWAWVLLGLGSLWLVSSAFVQWAAARAHALGRRAVPACFRAPLPGPETDPLHIAFLGDLQRGVVDVAGPLAAALKAQDVDWLVSSGDFASHGEAPYYGVLLDAFDRAGCETPVRVVPGNHDLFPRRSKDDTIGGAVFERCFGARHWAYRVGPVLVVGLDNGADWLLEDQLPWLTGVLDEHEGVPWICVCHRPPFHFETPGAPPYADLEQLAPFLEARSAMLVVSGHLHDYRDETVNGVRYVVNAHGGDVHGLALRRDDFELLHVRVSSDGRITTDAQRYRRRASWRTAWNQTLVRMWADRRKPLGAFIAWPVDRLLRLVGRATPVPRYPEERRHPDPETLRARRAAQRAEAAASRRPGGRAVVRQLQFLDVVPVDEAHRRWHEALDLQALGGERVALTEAHGRVLAGDVIAPSDVPAFDRSNVDGFAVRAADTFGASEREPVSLRLVGDPIDAGHAPAGAIETGTARTIATGGVIPRSADAVVMVEDTEPAGEAVLVFKPVAPGGRISAAGSDVARGETILRRGTLLTARETGTLAACGIDAVSCTARVRVAIISTGDEIVAPGTPLAPGQVHDANATLLADAVREQGGEPHILGIAPDETQALRKILDRARADYDVTLLSGGTSKGGGDLSYRVLETLAPPVVHGVALKPGKPLCLAAWDRKPVAILPGFPTSAIFTFHAFIAPVLRRLMGRPPNAEQRIEARVPRRMPSDRGRSEFTLVNLVRGRDGLVAFPLGKGSGSVTTFARADGFFEVPANVEYVEAGDVVHVTLLGGGLEPADLVVIGSHCVGLDIVLRHLAADVGSVKVISAGSRGGIEAAGSGACDIAPLHLLDRETGRWNAPFAPEGVRLVRGYERRQGLAFRVEHAERLGDGPVDEAMRAAAADPTLRIANRNPSSGTRVLIEALLRDGDGEAARPAGWATTYRSHTAVAAAIAQGRADYGICLEQAAKAAGLEWRACRSEQYDFLVPEDSWERPAVRAFRAALESEAVRDALRDAGFVP